MAGLPKILRPVERHEIDVKNRTTTTMRFCAWVLVITSTKLASAAIDADEVKSFPGYSGDMPSKVYSGYLKASAPDVTGKEQTFFAHYVLTLSQRSPEDDPLVLWQQGGPGSSGLGFGYFAELGPYQLTQASLTSNSTAVPRPFLNPHSWDQRANLLIFEHPPGTGFSYCVADGGNETSKPTPCSWDDQTQAVAFHNTLKAFYASYSEFTKHDLFVIGESYAGLLIPFLVSELMKHPRDTAALQLRAIAVGNGCPGTSGATRNNPGTCNGPFGNYDTQHIFELAYGHSAVSRKLHDAIVDACGFPCAAPTWSEDCSTFSGHCEQLLEEFSRAVGEFNIYNFFDNCGPGNQLNVDVSAEASFSKIRNVTNGATVAVGTFSELRRRFAQPVPGGGQAYPCGTGRAAAAWCNNDDARAGINMKPLSFYGRPWTSQAGVGMDYDHYTGASFDLYPDIVKRYRTVIYNGDVDACVPYNSNEDWTVALAAQQGWQELEAWRPWTVNDIPAGYVTSYGTPGPANFTFLTVKNSGHMVPQYQPSRALAFFERWLAGGPY